MFETASRTDVARIESRLSGLESEIRSIRMDLARKESDLKYRIERAKSEAETNVLQLIMMVGSAVFLLIVVGGELLG